MLSTCLVVMATTSLLGIDDSVRAGIGHGGAGLDVVNRPGRPGWAPARDVVRVKVPREHGAHAAIQEQGSDRVALADHELREDRRLAGKMLDKPMMVVAITRTPSPRAWSSCDWIHALVPSRSRPDDCMGPRVSP